MIGAYDNSDTLVQSTSFAYSLGDQPVQLEVSAASISYVLLSSGGDNPNSMMWDNLSATAVPEPATIAVLCLGAAAILRRRNRR